MDVAADGNGCFDWGGIGLFWKDSGGLFGDEFDLFFGDSFEIFEVINDDIYLVFIAHRNNIKILPFKTIAFCLQSHIKML